ncbi:MAG TPA: electron transfer flavoprotein subunit alpha/FixB family protein [Desulfobacteraceae bacterium]|nr:electron transfer flavoprotein subunit alpha/FixB family protein [Desulfobacteraceae bacterium]
MKRTCIFQDTDRPGSTPDLLGAAKKLHGDRRAESHVVIINGSIDEHLGVFNHIHRVADGLVAEYDPKGLTQILENLQKDYGFDYILIPDTNLGKMIAPRLAQRLEAGLVSGVTDIKRRGEDIEIRRPAFSGKILEGIKITGSGPVVLGLRPNAFDYTSTGRLKTTVSEYTTAVTTRSAVKRLRVAGSNGDIQTGGNKPRDIRDSEVIIAGGGGAKDHFTALNKLAEALGGTVAASRKLVDQGIAPRAIQVGQSGKTVSPRLYMAIGIHGSMQHLAGLRQVDTLISVNKTAHAPICSLSDIVVQGDAGEFIRRLMEKIVNDRSGRKGS